VGRALHLGVVKGFDERRGIGSVTDDAGTRWTFHCTQIADGTRAIEVGARVAFVEVAGHLGRMEAVSLVKLGARPD
jgi:cold shock CspA family protein